MDGNVAREVLTFLDKYGVLLATFGFVMLMGVGAYLARPREGMGKMSKEDFKRREQTRKAQERQAVCDMIEEGLLKLHSQGKLSETGYRNWHLRLGHEFNLNDLLPGKITAAELKVSLKKRRNGGNYHGIYKPVKLPGERKLNQLEILMHRL
jgi:hypothetical protein